MTARALKMPHRGFRPSPDAGSVDPRRFVYTKSGMWICRKHLKTVTASSKRER